MSTLLVWAGRAEQREDVRASCADKRWRLSCLGEALSGDNHVDIDVNIDMDIYVYTYV